VANLAFEALSRRFDSLTGRQVLRFNTVFRDREIRHETWGGGGGDPEQTEVHQCGLTVPMTRSQFNLLGDMEPPVRTGTLTQRPEISLQPSPSVIARDADPGKLNCYLPVHTHPRRFSAVTPLSMVHFYRIEWQGKASQGMLWANRKFFFSVLDRTTGHSPETVSQGHPGPVDS